VEGRCCGVESDLYQAVSWLMVDTGKGGSQLKGRRIAGGETHS
jgi:hypothetical protein